MGYIITETILDNRTAYHKETNHCQLWGNLARHSFPKLMLGRVCLPLF